MPIARSPENSASVALLLLGVLDAGPPRPAAPATPPRIVTTRLAKCLRVRARGPGPAPAARALPCSTPAGRHVDVLAPQRRDHHVRADARARPCAPAGAARGSRASRPPTTVTLPTPSTVSMRRLIVSSARRVRSRSAQPVARTRARLTIGDLTEVEPRDDRRVDVGGQAPRGCASILARTSACASMTLVLELELDEDRREALDRRRLDALDALDRVDRLLDLLGDVALDRLGARARGTASGS